MADILPYKKTAFVPIHQDYGGIGETRHRQGYGG